MQELKLGVLPCNPTFLIWQVQELKLGVFTSALVTDVEESSVWTVPMMDVLVPALEAALWRLKPPFSLPPKPTLDQLVGSYGGGEATVYAQAGALLLRLGSADPLNLTAVVPPAGRGGAPPGVASPKAPRAADDDDDDDYVFFVQPLNSTQGCRWLDDGQDLEMAYFERGSAPARAGQAARGEGRRAGAVVRLRFMDSLFDKDGEE